MFTQLSEHNHHYRPEENPPRTDWKILSFLFSLSTFRLDRWDFCFLPECDVNCHKKCERLTANLCGVNQKLIVEALANVKRGKTKYGKIKNKDDDNTKRKKNKQKIINMSANRHIYYHFSFHGKQNANKI